MIIKKTVVSSLVASALLAMSGSAAASGFALIEQSASGLGNAYAGGAAVAEDASTVFFNPAGMSQIKGTQVVIAGHLIKPSAKFSDTGSTAATFSGQPVGGNGGNAGSLALVPNFYFVTDIQENLKFGLGVTVPFGLKTEYEAGWAGRFQALKSEVKTINVNPSLSFKVNDAITVGFGVDYQEIEAELTNNIVLGAGVVGDVKVSGKDNAWGYNWGVLWQVSDETRVGLAYRSSLDYKIRGDILVTGPTGAVVQNPLVTSKFETPDTFSLSAFNKVNSQWDVMADISWTRWSTFKELRFVNAGNGNTQGVTFENWKDTYRFSLGSNYHYNEQLTARVGVAFDQGPVSDADRTARIPDNDRTWIAFGGQYKLNQTSTFDIGYAHLFVKTSTINNNDSGTTGTPSTATVGNLVGTYKNSVDILSLQYTHNF
jgi:long-chain fatty acid transport protein